MFEMYWDKPKIRRDFLMPFRASKPLLKSGTKTTRANIVLLIQLKINKRNDNN